MRYFVLIICILLLALPISAQNDTETISLSGAFDITIPDNWEVTSHAGAGYFWETENSELRIRSYSPLFMVDYELEDIDALVEFLVIEVFDAREINTDEVETVQFGDYEGQGYTFEQNFEGNRFMRSVYAYQMENDFIVVGYIKPNEGHDLNTDDVDALLAALASGTVQDVFTFYEGTQFDIPEGWQMIDDINTGFAGITLTNDSLKLDIGLWPSYGGIEEFKDSATFFAWLYDPRWIDIEPLDRSRIDDTQIAGFDAISYYFVSDKLDDYGMYNRATFMFDISNNSAFTVEVYSQEMDEPIDAIYGVLDTMVPGDILVCALFASPGIRMRAEATTSSDMVRQTYDETLVATYKIIDDNNYTWFNVGEGWIRSDVIFFDNNACDAIPTRNR